MYVCICNAHIHVMYTGRCTCGIDFASTNYFPLAPSAPRLPRVVPGTTGAAEDGKGVRWEARGRWPTRSKYGDVKSIKRANSRYCKSFVCVYRAGTRLAWLPLNCVTLSSRTTEYSSLQHPVICMVNPLTMPTTCVHYVHERIFRIIVTGDVCTPEKKHLSLTSMT